MALPIYEMVINTDEESDVEVSFVALVDKPAIEKNFLAFQAFVEPGPTENEDEFIGRCIPVMIKEGYEQEQASAICYSKWREKGKAASQMREAKKMRFTIQDEEEKIISGPLMLADTPIYRFDAQGEYYVVFSADTIKKIAQKYFKKGYQSNVNLMHDNGQVVDGVTMFESFIVDSKRGIKAMKGFEDVPEGSWFGSFKVENEEVWEKIKSGELQGFSVEGIFGFTKPANGTDLGFRHFNIEDTIMQDIKQLWEAFKMKFLEPEKVNMETATLMDGTKVEVDKLEVGGKVVIDDAPAPAGEHTLADGTVIVLDEMGIIQAIKPVEVEDDMGKKYDEKFASIDAKFGELSSTYEAKFAQQSAQLNDFAQKFAKANETINQLVELVGKIIETPTADSVVKTQGFNNQRADRTQKVMKLAETLKQIKTK